MNSLLIVRVSQNLTKCATKNPFSARALSTVGTRIFTNNLANNARSKPLAKYVTASIPRCYTSKRFSSSEKFTPNQVEAKVLEIIKNFDRVKENPAKPQVKFGTQKSKLHHF